MKIKLLQLFIFLGISVNAFCLAPQSFFIKSKLNCLICDSEYSFELDTKIKAFLQKTALEINVYLNEKDIPRKVTELKNRLDWILKNLDDFADVKTELEKMEELIAEVFNEEIHSNLKQIRSNNMKLFQLNTVRYKIGNGGEQSVPFYYDFEDKYQKGRFFPMLINFAVSKDSFEWLEKARKFLAFFDPYMQMLKDVSLWASPSQRLLEQVNDFRESSNEPQYMYQLLFLLQGALVKDEVIFMSEQNTLSLVQPNALHIRVLEQQV